MNAKEIGIIGGADGPTSIFVTVSVDWPFIIIIGLIVVIGSIVVWKRLHKKK